MASNEPRILNQSVRINKYSYYISKQGRSEVREDCRKMSPFSRTELI